MTKNRSLIFLLTALFLLTVVIACDIFSGTTVDCNVPDLIASINNANANPAPSTLNLDPGCVYTLTGVDNEAISEFNGSTFDYGDNGLPQITTPITINARWLHWVIANDRFMRTSKQSVESETAKTAK